MIRRLWMIGVAVLALYFAFQAGEYSSLDLIKQRKKKERLTFVADSLQAQVDSLTKIEAMVRGDPKTQERIAREEFGMVRGDNEILYKFIEPLNPDSTSPAE